MEALVRGTESLRRHFTLLKRRHSQLRHLVPLSVAQRVLDVAAMAGYLRPYYVGVREVARYENLFHCCIHKTGSQWLRSILSDVRTFQYSGLLHHRYSRGNHVPTATDTESDRQSAQPFPIGRIVSPLYITYQDFRLIPKRGSYRAFFVMRDPRNIVVSWYFSARYNHLIDRMRRSPLTDARRHLSGMTEADGLAWSVRYLAAKGRFATVGSWAEASHGENVMIVRFEDLTSPNAFAEFARLFAFLDIRMPRPMLRDLLHAYSFRRLAGRDRTQENTRSHLRGGAADNWRRYFTPAVQRQFYETTGDLVSRLGYE